MITFDIHTQQVLVCFSSLFVWCKMGKFHWPHSIQNAKRFSSRVLTQSTSTTLSFAVIPLLLSFVQRACFVYWNLKEMQIFSPVRYLVGFDDSPALLTIDFCGNSLFLHCHVTFFIMTFNLALKLLTGKII